MYVITERRLRPTKIPEGCSCLAHIYFKGEQALLWDSTAKFSLHKIHLSIKFHLHSIVWLLSAEATNHGVKCRNSRTNCQLFKLLMPNFLIIDLTTTDLEALVYFSGEWCGRDPDWRQLTSLTAFRVKCLLPISSSISWAGGGSSWMKWLDAWESAEMEIKGRA